MIAAYTKNLPGHLNHSVLVKDVMLVDKGIHIFQIKDAMKIGVVGGGAVGVEIAGDILEDYKDKADVYLIHPRETLVNDKVNDSFQSTVKNKLTSLGVNMVLGK